MKAKEPSGPRSAHTQPASALGQSTDKALPSNKSLTPRAENGCTAAPEPWDHSAPGGTLSENLSESAAGAVTANITAVGAGFNKMQGGYQPIPQRVGLVKEDQ